MIILNTQLIGRPVASLQTGAVVGKVVGMIIAAEDLKVMALYIKQRDTQDSILYTAEIREINFTEIIIDNAEQITGTEGLPKLKKIIDQELELPGKKVITEDGDKLGKIESFGILSETWHVSKLNIAQTLLKSLTHSNKIINRSQIIDVNKDAVVVKSSSVKVEKKKVATALSGNN